MRLGVRLLPTGKRRQALEIAVAAMFAEDFADASGRSTLPPCPAMSTSSRSGGLPVVRSRSSTPRSRLSRCAMVTSSPPATWATSRVAAFLWSIRGDSLLSQGERIRDGSAIFNCHSFNCGCPFSSRRVPVGRQSRPPPRPGFSASRRFLDLRQEAFVAEWLALVQREPDVVDRRSIQMRPEERAIGRLPIFVIRSQRQIQRMRRQSRFDFSESIGAIAGPAIVRQIIDHGGSHGVEFTVSLARQQIGLGLNQR